MLRFALLIALLFSAPFLLYIVWQKLFMRGLGQRGIHFSRQVFYRLLIGGILLVLVVVLFLVDYDTADPDGVYIPPYYDGGKLVPGQIIKPDTKLPER